MMPVPAALLPIAEICPEAMHLGKLGARRADAWREAFRFGVTSSGSALTAMSLSAYKASKEALPDRVAVAVEEAVNDVAADYKLGIIPTGARFVLKLDSSDVGLAPPEDPISFAVDHAWSETPKSGASIAVVLQHELIMMGSPPPTALDLALAGIVFAAGTDSDRMKLGRCYHSPGKPQIYKWTDVIEDAEMMTYWGRIARIWTRERIAVEGPHCETCDVRRACATWQLPILERPHDVMAILMSRTGVASHNAVRLRRLVAAMREAVAVGEGQLRAYDREQGVRP